MSTTAQNIAKINAKFAQAAARLGTSFNVYRPGLANATNQSPIIPENLVTTLLASFPRNYGYLSPQVNGKADRELIADLSQIKVGDYLIGTGADTCTYFISAMPVLQPVTAYVCNRIVQLSTVNARSSTKVGKQEYSDKTPANTTVVVEGWPASILFAGRGRATLSDLPGDTTSAQYTLLLPPSFPTTPVPTGIITDDLNNNYAISSSEQSIGWRCLINQMEA